MVTGIIEYLSHCTSEFWVSSSKSAMGANECIVELEEAVQNKRWKGL